MQTTVSVLENFLKIFDGFNSSLRKIKGFCELILSTKKRGRFQRFEGWLACLKNKKCSRIDTLPVKTCFFFHIFKSRLACFSPNNFVKEINWNNSKNFAGLACLKNLKFQRGESVHEITWITSKFQSAHHWLKRNQISGKLSSPSWKLVEIFNLKRRI